MKVLQINVVYKNGSTGKITYYIHKELINKGYESIVCYGRGKKIKEPGIYKACFEIDSVLTNIISRFTGIMYGGCFISTINLIRLIKKEKPDIVHLQCLNGYFVNIYKLIGWLNQKNIKTVLTLHAEFMYTGNCGYALECNNWKNGCQKCHRYKRETRSIFIDNTHKSWKKMYNAFKGFKNLKVISVSQWLMNRAKQSLILKDFDNSVILNGIDTNIFKKYDTTILKRELGLKDKKIIFHATPYFSKNKDHIKGGYYILKLAERIKNDDIQIVIAGDYDQSIENIDNITFLGKIDNQILLAKYYSMADVFLLTSKRETFSMTTAESLCCGTPVVGFKAGAPEQIAIKSYSSFVEYGNIDELYNEIIKFLNKGKDNKLESMAKIRYSKENMAKKYIELYKNF